MPARFSPPSLLLTFLPHRLKSTPSSRSQSSNSWQFCRVQTWAPQSKGGNTSRGTRSLCSSSSHSCGTLRLGTTTLGFWTYTPTRQCVCLWS
ncbi:hypothetical protein C8R45DRAFT_1044640 [Mycena sanguinolenta]|nr:hypothetical protein C8R45DRAFT_1044640 [Mycena sanguinolenta]